MEARPSLWTVRLILQFFLELLLGFYTYNFLVNLAARVYCQLSSAVCLNANSSPLQFPFDDGALGLRLWFATVNYLQLLLELTFFEPFVLTVGRIRWPCFSLRSVGSVRIVSSYLVDFAVRVLFCFSVYLFVSLTAPWGAIQPSGVAGDSFVFLFEWYWSEEQRGSDRKYINNINTEMSILVSAMPGCEFAVVFSFAFKVFSGL